MRKLASIQRVVAVNTIEGADAIERITVQGWNLVAKKGEFRAGDLCIYFEIDSLLPIRPEFEFLAKGNTPKTTTIDGVEYTGYRLKTVRLRGQISQGLALPITHLASLMVGDRSYLTEIKPELSHRKITVAKDRVALKFRSEEEKAIYEVDMLSYVAGYLSGEIADRTVRAQHWDDGFTGLSFIMGEGGQKEYVRVLPYFEEGADMSTLLGIVKYEAPISASLAGQMKGGFPGFIFKTDEERIQNHTWILDEYKGTQFIATEKLDGTSMTVYHRDGEFGVCGRNIEYHDTPDNSFWKVAKELELDTRLKTRGNFALQGELIGPGIQKNIYRLNKPNFYVFNVFDIDKSEYLNIDQAIQFVFDLGVNFVPVLPHTLDLADYTLESLLKPADMKSLLNPSAIAENIVTGKQIGRAHV